MHAKHKGELAAMMEIMLDQMPDNILASKTFLSGISGRKNLFQIRSRPALKSGLHYLPGGFQAVNQFSRGSCNWLSVPSVPSSESFEFNTTLVQI